MSTARTGAVQRARMAELGLSPAILPPLRDVDTFEDALEVAAEAPDTRFATPLARDARGARWPHDRARRPSPPPLPADALYGRLLASAAQHLTAPGRRRARGSGSPTGGSSRSRSTAGSRPPTRSTRRSSRTSRRRCSTSAAARAATSRALRALGKRGLGVDLSPVAVALARDRGADVINGSLWATSRRRDAGGRSCCWTATSASAARRSRCSRAPASCSRPTARSSSRPTRRARRRIACGSGSRRRAWSRSGSAGRGSGSTVSAEVAARAGFAVEDGPRALAAARS